MSNRGRTIKLGGTTLELKYVGLNHSDSTLVMRLPKEKIIFVVDLLPVGRMPGRGMIDFYPLEAEDSIKKILAMDWERLIPGHPDSGGRLGTKKDVEQQLAILQDASAEMKKLGQDGKCWDDRRKGVQAAEVRHAGGLRGEPAIHRPALLRPVGPRHLNRDRAATKKRAARESGPDCFQLRDQPALRAASATDCAVWPNRMARSSAVRMPPWLGLIFLTSS